MSFGPDTPADLIRPQTLAEAAERFSTLSDEALEALNALLENQVWSQIDNLLALFRTPPFGTMLQQRVEMLGGSLQEQLEATLGHMAMHYAKGDWNLHDHGGILDDEEPEQS